MSIFSALVEAQFNGPFAEAVSYTAPVEGATLRGLRGIVRRPDEIADLYGPGAVLPTCLLDVPVSDLASPEEGASISVAGKSYTLKAYLRDSEGLIWKFHLQEFVTP